jgi:iron complex outermembrane receptor protein
MAVLRFREKLAAAGCALSLASTAVAAPEDLTELSLAALMNIEVTSVSKRVEPLSDAAAAIYVLTSEQLAQSGARNIAEALRQVPGVQVARSDGRGYAVSVRGFNSTSSDKLEVLLDGRSVYTPLFSGVFWDVLETDLADVERIEVIRGPGATLWGANAVNGVINITTKSALATPGGRVQLSAGNEETAALALRQTVRVADGAVRLSALNRWRDDAALADGGDAQDGSRFSQASARGDWEKFQGGRLSAGANIYDARFQALAGDTTARGESAQARWTLPTGAGEHSLSVWYEHYDRFIPGTYQEYRHTASLEYEVQHAIGARHELGFGVSWRYTQDHTGGPPLAILFDPADRTLNTYSAFLQDRWSLNPALTLTLGSKFEHNDLTGIEVQPSARLGWRARPDVFVWGAISRAVRTPNRLDQDIAIFCPPPAGYPGVCGPGTFRVGNPELDSEVVLAYETGLRLALARGLSADLALFHNDYSHLKSTEPTTVVGAFDNRLKGVGDGAELSLDWQAREQLNFSGSYSLLSLRTEPTDASGDVKTAPAINGSSPRHQLRLGGDYRFLGDWEFHAEARYLSRLPAQKIPDRAELGLRLAYTPHPHLKLSLSAENLLHDQAPEFGNKPATRSELQRSAWLSLSWTWP